jgi:hypothetical protein
MSRLQACNAPVGVSASRRPPSMRRSRSREGSVAPGRTAAGRPTLGVLSMPALERCASRRFLVDTAMPSCFRCRNGQIVRQVLLEDVAGGRAIGSVEPDLHVSLRISREESRTGDGISIFATVTTADGSAGRLVIYRSPEGIMGMHRIARRESALNHRFQRRSACSRRQRSKDALPDAF